MPDALPKAELLKRLISLATSEGATAAAPDDSTVAGEFSTIRSKWMLGGRKVVYKFSCQLDAVCRDVRFREASVESSWGMPPPTLTVETTSQRGTRVSETRTDKSVGGGGTLDYGRLRDAMEQAVGDAGWRFTVDAGRMP